MEPAAFNARHRPPCRACNSTAGSPWLQNWSAGDPARERFRSRRTAGSVIVLVLVTVTLTAFLLFKFVQRAGTELLADARAGDQARLRREAYSSLEVTLATLADINAIDTGLHSPAQGWDRPLEYAGYTPADGRTVEITFEDESGKISLPRANAATLQTLLEQLGLGPAEAEKASDALLVWTRADYVPASLDTAGASYERAALPYQPAQRPLRSFAELAAVEYVREIFFDENGRPTPLGQDFAANVSLYSFDHINLNAASPAVLAASGLAEAQSSILQDYTRQQAKPGALNYFQTVGDANAVLGTNAPLTAFSANVQALRINVTVRDGAAVFRLSAVVAPPGGATVAVAPAPATPATAPVTGNPTPTAAVVTKKLDYPFKVLEIQENVESPPPAPAIAHD
jgi:type II secretory pathway component PulK